MTIFKTDSQWVSAAQCGEFSLVLCDNLEWDGVGGGREVKQGGDICVSMADSC